MDKIPKISIWQQENFFKVICPYRFMCKKKIMDPKSLKTILKPICESQLSKAAYNRQFEIVMCILQNIDHKNPVIVTNKKFWYEQSTVLHWAAKHGQYSIFGYVNRFIDDINPNDIWGMTPLHFAAENGHFDIVKFIVQRIENPNLKAYGVNTPLDLASRSG